MTQKFKSKLTYLLTPLFILFIQVVYGQNSPWKFVINNSKGENFYLHNDYIITPEGKMRVAFLQTNIAKVVLTNGNGYKKIYSNCKTYFYYEFNCSDSTGRRIKYVTHNSQGIQISSFVSSDSQMKNFEENSVEKFILKKSCEKKL